MAASNGTVPDNAEMLPFALQLGEHWANDPPLHKQMARIWANILYCLLHTIYVKRLRKEEEHYREDVPFWLSGNDRDINGLKLQKHMQVLSSQYEVPLLSLLSEADRALLQSSVDVENCSNCVPWITSAKWWP